MLGLGESSPSLKVPTRSFIGSMLEASAADAWVHTEEIGMEVGGWGGGVKYGEKTRLELPREFFSHHALVQLWEVA